MTIKYAAVGGQAEVCKLLLDNGADQMYPLTFCHPKTGAKL